MKWLSKHSPGCLVAAGLLALSWSAHAGFGDEQAHGGKRPSNVPGDWKFEPDWRDRGDCGPLALYVLMQLEGRPRSIEEVKKVLHFDGEIGCSLADMARAAEALTFMTEVRYVNPQDLPRLAGPYIVHCADGLEKKHGHFVVVVGYNERTDEYSVIDTTTCIRQDLATRFLTTGYTGYVLIPAHKTYGPLLKQAASLLLFFLACILLAIAGFRSSARKKSRIEDGPVRP